MPEGATQWLRVQRSRKSRKLAVVGLSAFQERVLSFLCLFTEVVEKRRISGKLLQSSLTVSVDVERSLEKANCHRAFLENLARPLKRFFFELVERHNGVDQSHVESLLCVVLSAQVPDLARLLMTYNPR